MVVVTLETTMTPVELKPTTQLASVSEKAVPSTVSTSTCCTQEESSAVVSRAMIARLPSEKVYLLSLKVPEGFSCTTTAPSATRKRALVEKEETRDQPPAASSEKHFEEPRCKKARVIVKVKRAVRFELADDEIAIKTHIHVIDPVEADSIAELWWSGEEMMEISRREKSASAVMSYCCDYYTTQVLSLMKMARGMAMDATDAVSAPVWVASSPARGLEKEIVQGFRARKKQVIRKVLEVQRVLKYGRHEVTGKVASPDMMSSMLSDQYQKLSHPMLRFAQVLAEGDARAALDLEGSTTL